MSRPLTSPSSPSKSRIAGVALLGVAVIALVIGIIMAVSGGGSSNRAGETSTPAPPVSSTSESISPLPPVIPSTSTVVPTTSPMLSFPSGATTTIVPAPPMTNTQAAEPGVDTSTPVRVYNNSLVKGLAERAADDFRRAGYNVVQVSNYSQGAIPATTIYYRPGTGEQATAESLAKRFAAEVQPRFPGIANASPGVIAIITKDYKG